MQGPTYISSDVVPQKEAGFPAMTICPVSSSKGYKPEILEEHGISEVKNYNDARNGRVLNWSSNQSSVNESHLFNLATYKFDELVKRIYIRFFEADVS